MNSNTYNAGTIDAEKGVHHNGVTPAAGPRPSRIANPASLGLFSFASTTFILSLYNVQTRGVTTPNVVVGMAVFCGGLAQLLAGMWEFPRGNVFGATVFSSYGAFWMSFATVFIPGSGIISSYSNPRELDNALGIYLATWFIVTVLITIASLRTNAAFITLLVALALAFLFLSIGYLTGNAHTHTAGGAFGIISAVFAYYAGLSQLLTREHSYFSIPLGGIPPRTD